MDSSYFQLGLILVTLVVAGYALYRSHQRGEVINVAGVVSELKEAILPAKEVMDVISVAVQAAEQMKRDGRINTNDEAFNYVMDYAVRKIPKEWGITKEDIVMAIDAAVLASSALAKQAGESSGK